MIDGTPKVMSLAIDLHKYLIEMPLPIWMIGSWVHPFLAYFFGEDRAKPVPPIANGFVTNIDAAFMEQVFYIAKRKRKSDIHHHGKADNLGWCLEIVKGIMFFILKGYEKATIASN
jgi:hypothetical protein